MGQVRYLFSLDVPREGVKLIIVCAFWELQQRASENRRVMAYKLYFINFEVHNHMNMYEYDAKSYRIKLLQMARPDLMLPSATCNM